MTPNPSAEDLQKAAQCWCDPRVSDRVMDIELAKVFASALAEERKRAQDEAWNAAIDKVIWRISDRIGNYTINQIRSLKSPQEQKGGAG